eukprot:10355565-Alexandrium_andersonii.AAC.1
MTDILRRLPQWYAQWNDEAVRALYAEALPSGVSPEQLLGEFQVAREDIRRRFEPIPARRFGFNVLRRVASRG